MTLSCASPEVTTVLARLIWLLSMTVECESLDLNPLIVHCGVLADVEYERVFNLDELQEIYTKFEVPAVELNDCYELTNITTALNVRNLYLNLTH